MPFSLENAVSNWLSEYNFISQDNLLRGYLYINEEKNEAVIIDYGICNSEFIFKYEEYTEEQNKLM